MARSNQDDFDAYRKWLGISNQKRLPTHYELLAIGLDEDDPDVIQAAAEQRRHFVETKRGEGHDDQVTEILYRIDEAESTLLNTALRRDYDRKMDLFDKRRKNRQVDPHSRRSRVSSRSGRTVGEDGGIVKTFACIVAIICVAFGGMAWFGSRIQPKPAEIAPVVPVPAQVAQVPVAAKVTERPTHSSENVGTFPSIDDNPADSLKKKLAGTTWTNSNNVSFEWTKDGRFLHSGNERDWKVLDKRRVLITYGSAHSDTLVFNEDLTAFKQLIRGGPESFDGKLSSDLNSQAMKSLQGEWLLQTLNHDGKWIDEETLKAEDRLLTIVGDNFTLMRSKNGERNGHTGKIQMYSNGKFDFVGKGPGGNHIEWPGIYEVKGDTLKLHFWKSLSEGRPTDFVPIKGNLETYVRHDTTAKALKALQGEWLCIALNESGNHINENALKAQNRRVTIDGDNFTLMRTRDGNRTGHIGKIQIGPNDTFDFVGKGPAGGNNEWPGIYEIKGDTLKLRFANQLSDGRPKDFSPGQGNLETYVRN